MLRSLTRTLIVGGAVAAASAFYRSEAGQRLRRELIDVIERGLRRPGDRNAKTDANGVEVEALDRMTDEGGLAA